MSEVVFVCGATGTQGGAVARHLRKANATVHALVREPKNAKALADMGVLIFQGSYDDTESLRAALKGATSAFLNFMPSFTDISQELRHANAVISAARDEGVRHIVYSSSFGLEEDETTRPGLDPDGIVAKIYQVKRDITREITKYPSYTILRPAKFLSDLIGPAAAWFGDLTTTGIFETALTQGQTSPYVDPDDIGAFGAAALLSPEKFSGHRVDVFTALLTPEDLVSGLAEATGKRMSVRFLSEVEVEEKKKRNLLLEAQITMKEKSALANLDQVKSWGVPVGSYEDFLEREKKRLDDTYTRVPSKQDS
ncbi:hypothetical protein jhhlp_008243 [Lomentospora prolificans]|uniref:NmrA-like domain-containing protein n=1 Tax=Lomentospora prolificans TaxID=41688 RepID=A0A2N3MXH2_9PEZI|nr:hypothetical protein jhhlp_008243 [Lomentospora prolificans]